MQAGPSQFKIARLNRVNNPYTLKNGNGHMRTGEKDQTHDHADDLEDISIVKNLLELQSRLKSRTDSIETLSE
ncbi:hypothetical protein J2P12_05705 [Candidatus Bathyarchaeota archaeon]|nr:hypothetical protein [Candidatus Bathyarchaeota archaeon]